MWLKSKKKKKKTKRRNRRKHRDGWGLAGRFLMLIMDPHATRRFHPTHQCTGCPAIHLFFNLFLESVCLLGVMAALEEMESSPLFISACSPQWGSPPFLLPGSRTTVWGPAAQSLSAQGPLQTRGRGDAGRSADGTDWKPRSRVPGPVSGLSSRGLNSARVFSPSFPCWLFPALAV